jgi:hypothetical protein
VLLAALFDFSRQNSLMSEFVSSSGLVLPVLLLRKPLLGGVQIFGLTRYLVLQVSDILLNLGDLSHETSCFVLVRSSGGRTFRLGKALRRFREFSVLPGLFVFFLTQLLA